MAMATPTSAPRPGFSYGDLLTDAWRITWRNRGLWLFGLFAGSASGSCSGLNLNTGGNPQDLVDAFNRGAGRAGAAQTPPALPSQAEIQAALTQVLPILVAVGLVFLVLWLAFWLLSVACQGTLLAGGAAEAEGR